MTRPCWSNMLITQLPYPTFFFFFFFTETAEIAPPYLCHKLYRERHTPSSQSSAHRWAQPGIHLSHGTGTADVQFFLHSSSSSALSAWVQNMLHQWHERYHFPIGLNCACLFFSQFPFFLYLPLKDLPERWVLDPLDLVYGAVGHGVFEQHLNAVILLHWFGERNELEQRNTVHKNSRWMKTRSIRNRYLLRKYLVFIIWRVNLLPVRREALSSGRAGAVWRHAATKIPAVKIPHLNSHSDVLFTVNEVRSPFQL